MLRRTLLAFLALLFLVLAITLGYAALGLSGPDTAVKDAQLAFADRQFARCVRILDLAEQGLGQRPNQEVQLRILAIRHEAYHELGNVRSALRDLSRLREARPDDLELLQKAIRWTIESGDALQGLELAEARLATHPDEPRTVELAGEACQARYQELVREFLAEYATLLDQEAATRAFAALRTWLYRDENDPVAAEGFEAFEAVLRDRRPTAFAAGKYAIDLQEIRGLVTRAQRYFRDALEVDAQPVAAYAGLAYAFRQGGRSDDMQWLGEIYLHRFRHAYATLAAVDMAQVHFDAGRNRAVIELSQRFLPRDSWRSRAADGRLLSVVRDLRLAEARALTALGNTDSLNALCQEVRDMQAGGTVNLLPELEWIFALDAIARGDFRVAMMQLQEYDQQLQRLPPTDEVVTRRIAVFEQRIRIARQRNWPPRFFEWAFRSLSELDQTNPRYFVQRSQLRLDSDDVEGALLDLRTAWALAEHDDDVLQVRARAFDTQQARSGRDSASQLKRCIELGLTVPYDIDDVVLLPLAELAMEHGRYEIALDCAQRASTAFNWARWPRELASRAAFALGRYDLAEQIAAATLAHHPGDLEGLRRLREAREKQGKPIDDLTYDLLLAGEADPGIAASLLRRTLARKDMGTATHLSATILRRWPDDPSALLPVAEVQRLRNDVDVARETLQRAADLSAESDPETYSEATHRYFLLTASTSDDPELVERLFRRALSVSADDTARLGTLALDLHRAGLESLSFRVLEELLTASEHRSVRVGTTYRLAGRLALGLGLVDKAERYLLAALTFPETQDASRPLALLLFSKGRAAEAAESYWDPTVTDLVSACLSARAGRVEPALDWARSELAKSTSNLKASALLALHGESTQRWPALEELVQTAPDELLDTLTFLDAQGFEETALDRAKALNEVAPRNLFARTLLARAWAGVGNRMRGLELLTDVVAEAPALIPAYDAAAEMLEPTDTGPLAVDELVERFVDPELIQGGLATSDMLELATRREAVRLLATIGERPDVLESLTALWEFAPGAERFGMQYVELLASHGRADLALSLCRAIEPRTHPDLREPFYVLYFHLLREQIASADDPDLQTSALADAHRFIGRDGPLGVLVHFVMDQEEEVNGPFDERADVERVARARQLLNAHLDHIRSGRERFDASVIATLRRIHQVDGRTRATELAEELLREDPSRVSLWLARAGWLVEENRVDEAVESLGWIREYLPTSPIVLGCVELTARAGRSDPDDGDRLKRDLDPALLSTPSAQHVLGLLAFREADYARAAELFARGGRRLDGSHLYFTGLAALILGDPERASACLEELVRDYPKSSFSFNARHFARQLSH